MELTVPLFAQYVADIATATCARAASTECTERWGMASFQAVASEQRTLPRRFADLVADAVAEVAELGHDGTHIPLDGAAFVFGESQADPAPKAQLRSGVEKLWTAAAPRGVLPTRDDVLRVLRLATQRNGPQARSGGHFVPDVARSVKDRRRALGAAQRRIERRAARPTEQAAEALWDDVLSWCEETTRPPTAGSAATGDHTQLVTSVEAAVGHSALSLRRPVTAGPPRPTTLRAAVLAAGATVTDRLHAVSRAQRSAVRHAARAAAQDQSAGASAHAAATQQSRLERSDAVHVAGRARHSREVASRLLAQTAPAPRPATPARAAPSPMVPRPTSGAGPPVRSVIAPPKEGVEQRSRTTAVRALSDTTAVFGSRFPVRNTDAMNDLARGAAKSRARALLTTVLAAETRARSRRDHCEAVVADDRVTAGLVRDTLFAWSPKRRRNIALEESSDLRDVVPSV